MTDPMPDDRPVSPEEHDERESAYANGYGEDLTAYDTLGLDLLAAPSPEAGE